MDELITLIKDALPSLDITSGNRLISDHIIDSLSFLSLISVIIDHYKIEIPFEAMVPENFDSIEAIYKLIQSINSQNE